MDHDYVLQVYLNFVVHLGIAAVLTAAISMNVQKQLDAYNEAGLNPPEELTRSLDCLLMVILAVPLCLFLSNLCFGLT